MYDEIKDIHFCNAETMIGYLILILLSCNNSVSNSNAASLKPVEIKNGNVSINYDDSKRGDTALLFIHGWNINKTYWENQRKHFSGQYRIVTVDLPGFGKSGKNRKNFTIEEYGKDITAVIKQLDLNKVILIGHSMSGATIVEAALKNASRVIGIIGIDNFTGYGTVLTDSMKKDIAEAYYKLKLITRTLFCVTQMNRSFHHQLEVL